MKIYLSSVDNTILYLKKQNIAIRLKRENAKIVVILCVFGVAICNAVFQIY